MAFQLPFKNRHVKKYDHVISLGQNCEVAFQFKRKFGFVTSHLFNWTNIQDCLMLPKVIENGKILFSEGAKPLPEYNMFQCNATKIYFHAAANPQDLLDADGKILQTKLDSELENLKGRAAYLRGRLENVFQSNDSQLYVITLNEAHTPANEEFIKGFLKTLRSKNAKAELLAVLSHKNAEKLKHIEGSGLFIRSISHFSPHDDVANKKKSDIKGWDAIFDEFQPKQILTENKKYKFEASASKQTPKISVVMSCYNRAGYIKDAIDSILNQTFADFEFIIIDDCSTDHTPNIIQSYADKDDRIVFIRNRRNMDYNHNLRKGFEIARGEYIARMDDDDISFPTRFEKQVKYLDENPEVVVLGTFINTFGAENFGTWVLESDPDKIGVLMHFFNPLCHPTAMIRNAFLKKHKLNYSPKELYAEEYHLWKEILLRGGKLANLPEILLDYRCHKQSVTRGRKTKKIQRETAIRVKTHLLSPIFKTKKELDTIFNTVVHPFSNTDPQKLLPILETMKSYYAANPAYFEALNQLQEKYCFPQAENDQPPQPAFSSNNIPIILSANDNYSPYLGVCIHSLIENSSPQNNYDIIILHQDISEENRAIIQEMSKENVSIRFFNVTAFLNRRGRSLFLLKTFYSLETYFRLFLPEITAAYDKILYLDCDTVVLRDVAELFAVDIGENYLGATRDLFIIDMRHTPSFEFYNPETFLYYTSEMDRYLKDVIQLQNCNDYFQAGVALWNIKKMREDNLSEKFFQKLREIGDPRYVDQCVLNAVCAGKVHFFSQKWNLIWNIFLSTTKYMPTQFSNDLQAYAKGSQDPWILHFTGPTKPWHNPSLPMAIHFWKAARKTAFYEKILFKNVQQHRHDDPVLMIRNYRKKKRAYIKHKILARLTFGKTRRQHRARRKELKAQLKLG